MNYKDGDLSVLFITPYWSAFRFMSVPVSDVCVHRHVLPFTDVKWNDKAEPNMHLVPIVDT